MSSVELIAKVNRESSSTSMDALHRANRLFKSQAGVWGIRAVHTQHRKPIAKMPKQPSKRGPLEQPAYGCECNYCLSFRPMSEERKRLIKKYARQGGVELLPGPFYWEFGEVTSRVSRGPGGVKDCTVHWPDWKRGNPFLRPNDWY